MSVSQAPIDRRMQLDYHICRKPRAMEVMEVGERKPAGQPTPPHTPGPAPLSHRAPLHVRTEESDFWRPGEREWSTPSANMASPPARKVTAAIVSAGAVPAH